ncbi:hypothetical protein WA026_010329 [Henosepilachna vigintioctopunctata]|uniref:DUF4773 domain-containing protein n=1 Tax=Henosepilachna vigintioctopunctata TaxID=420089 RepID=A0AAW1V9I0_9CUCU
MQGSLFLLFIILLEVENVAIAPGFSNSVDERDMDGGKNQSRKLTDPDADEMNIFYDLQSHSPFRVTSIENSFINPPELSDQSFTKSGKILRRIGYRANGCSCQELTCGCCLGINMSQFDFNREGCMKFTYLPKEFAINMNVIMDGNPIYQNSVSAKNPPPFCMPFAIPGTPIALPLDFCAKLYDIYTEEQNIHMCFDLEAKFSNAEVLVLHFDCMVMGAQGTRPLKPGEAVFSTTTSSDVLDPVNETKK